MYRRLSTVKWSRALLVPDGAQTGMRIDEAVFGVTGHSKPARHSSLSAGYHSCTKPSSKFHNLESRLGIVTMDARVRTQSVRASERERQNKREFRDRERQRRFSGTHHPVTLVIIHNTKWFLFFECLITKTREYSAVETPCWQLTVGDKTNEIAILILVNLISNDCM